MEIVEKRGEKTCAIGAGLAPPSGVSGKRRNPDATGEAQERVNVDTTSEEVGGG
jgi:hypothetical protein